MSHTCDAAIVSCIDFRFQKFIQDWIAENLKDKTYDYVGFAGATKDLETAMNQIELSIKLHSIKEVYLMHHEECGAYGAESTPEKHAEDLRKAKNEIITKYPNLEVQMFYLHLDGTFEEIG